MMAQFISEQRNANAEQRNINARYDSSIRNLEVQMGQLATAVNNLKTSGLPSDTIPNPRREGREKIEECKAITLRSGKQLPKVQETVSRPDQEKKTEPSVVIPVEDEISEKEKAEEDPRKEQDEVKSEDGKKGQEKIDKQHKWVPPLPFPQRFAKKKLDEQYLKFLDILKQLQVNIPFVELLENMPRYAKFMKEVLTKKRRFYEYETVALTEKCSSILQRKIPPKTPDLGEFLLPCNIGDVFKGKALCDLGASINLMPLSLCKRLGLGTPKPTTVVLKLADGSHHYPVGVLEDMLVKVGEFILPADFLVLDYEENDRVPLIFGRPLLATGGALIDVAKGEITLRVSGDELKFQMFKEANGKKSYLEKGNNNLVCERYNPGGGLNGVMETGKLDYKPP